MLSDRHIIIFVITGWLPVSRVYVHFSLSFDTILEYIIYYILCSTMQYVACACEIYFYDRGS